jgi:hypothetical protein
VIQAAFWFRRCAAAVCCYSISHVMRYRNLPLSFIAVMCCTGVHIDTSSRYQPCYTTSAVHFVIAACASLFAMLYPAGHLIIAGLHHEAPHLPCCFLLVKSLAHHHQSTVPHCVPCCNQPGTSTSALFLTAGHDVPCCSHSHCRKPAPHV